MHTYICINKYTYAHILTTIQLYAHMFVHKYACKHVGADVYLYFYKYMYMNLCAYVYTHTHTKKCMHTYMYTGVYMCIYTSDLHLGTYTYTHIYIYIYISVHLGHTPALVTTIYGITNAFLFCFQSCFGCLLFGWPASPASQKHEPQTALKTRQNSNLN